MKNVILCMLMLVLLSIISGCATLPRQTGETIIPATAHEAMMQAVQKTNWLVTISILGIAASVVALFHGSKNAIPIAVGCFVCLVLALMVTRYAMVLASGGLIVALGVAGYAIYVKSKALRQIIGGVQNYKGFCDKFTNTERDRVLRNCLSGQSPSTKTIVKEVKEKL